MLNAMRRRRRRRRHRSGALRRGERGACIIVPASEREKIGKTTPSFSPSPLLSRSAFSYVWLGETRRKYPLDPGMTRRRRRHTKPAVVLFVCLLFKVSFMKKNQESVGSASHKEEGKKNGWTPLRCDFPPFSFFAHQSFSTTEADCFLS